MFLTKEKKSPYYQIVYFIDGKRTKKSTKKKTKEEAEKELRRFLLHFNNQYQKQKFKPIPLSQFINEYISYCKNNRSNSYVNRSIIPAFNKINCSFGNVPLHKINPRQVDNFISSINNYSPSAAGLYYRTLKAAFSKAVVWEYIQENPFKKIKAPKQVKSLPIFINKSELQIILSNTKHQFLKDIFITAFYSGMRLSELLNVRWSWIDFEQKIITVKNSNGFITKSKKERIIPIHSNVEEVLISRNTANTNLNKDEIVFSRYAGIKLNGDFVSKQFKRAVRQAGLNDDI
jgi:integrase